MCFNECSSWYLDLDHKSVRIWFKIFDMEHEQMRTNEFLRQLGSQDLLAKASGILKNPTHK